MKSLIYFLFLLLSYSLLYPQQTLVNKISISSKKRILLHQEDILFLPKEVEQKILSGKLIQNVSEKRYLLAHGLITMQQAKELVVIYMGEYPTTEQVSSLTDMNINCLLNVWTPPLKNHPYGFFLAEIPVDNFSDVLSLSFVKKIDTAEYEKFPQNNYGVTSINADDVWLMGYDGTGVKVGVLDSGIDTYYDGTEFPTSFTRKDYSNYPTLDDIVENTATGHGTHVAATVLGRGTNSIGRVDEGNGLTPFRGSAPGADLIFLKIGLDGSGSANDASIIGAMNDAVTVYNADVLSMSYGGWDTYHDGGSAIEQKADWVYSQGVPIFLSAGNEADNKHHYSATVPAGGSTGFIAINTSSGSALTFNLVWYDGLGTNNNLYMNYYNNSFTELAKSETPTTESLRGTESKFSYHTSIVSAGTYYVKVFNTSTNSQFFHIFFDDWGYPNVTFVSSDPEYTIGSPASADYGFAVGSYVSRDTWIAWNGTGPFWYGPSFVLNDIAPYSSRGPRVNGGVQKPNIAAPGSAIISLRDTDVYTVANNVWIDNDGITGFGGRNYYVMTGTSMACPMVAGSAALLLDLEPNASPQLIYDAIQNSANTSGTGIVPNNTWGYGKLDVLAATNEPLPVELSSFTAKVLNNGGIILNWRTETEINNYGFEIERLQDYYIEKLQGWNKIGFVAGHGNSNSPKEYSFTDNNAEYGKYAYRLKQIDTDGSFEYSKVIEVNAGKVPDGFVLEQNYPNPFNPTTTIKFAVAETQRAELKVYDILGNEVRTLFNETAEGGKVYEIEFDASKSSSGIYLYKLSTVNNIKTRKMLIVK